MGKNFRETLNEQLRDPAFKAEWDALEPERQIMRAILEGRDEQSLTQKQLAARLQTAGCDLTESMVGQIEIGYRAASIFEIDKFVEVLKVDYNALFAQD